MGDDSSDETPLSPGDAFAALGHEIRVGILEALADATRVERPLAFSELRGRVGTVDSAKFNYHLGELVGHFVARTDDGYDLRPAGERVAEAVLSGAVTDDPVMDRVPIDATCPYCGAGVEMAYRDERTAAFCPECRGAYAMSAGRVEKDAPDEYGFLGYLDLPPAGIQNRTPTEVFETALRWHLSGQLLASTGTCSRCSAPMEEWLTLCDDHEGGDGACPECDNRYAAQHSARCTNCVYSRRTTFGVYLLDSVELQSFLTAHGVDLVSPDYDQFASVVMNYGEEIHDADPFEASFTFTADGDAITLTVDDDFDVVDVAEQTVD
ncbi:winged helix-turn-helix domain-containing protein [Halobacterium litoreum]|uniref:Winged helix-turn-helix domain-containing protein n=1 Tax=Halobacterium litoreum TaxID=2039234 RepID=A0ABD5NC32_9EURY|nr:winged helix-turn-helix domain-containing protein [Halobacterium litoreum]UHH14279.1 winged helix-turn-helix domain-containing protein [Halobacterium litoreum]